VQCADDQFFLPYLPESVQKSCLCVAFFGRARRWRNLIVWPFANKQERAVFEKLIKPVE